MQAAWRKVVGKDPILDQNPLMEDTTIPEEVWDRRYEKRKADAAKELPAVKRVFANIDTFRSNLRNPEFDYFPALIDLLIEINELSSFTEHKQLAIELTNYVKKLLLRQFKYTRGDARSEEHVIQEALIHPELKTVLRKREPENTFDPFTYVPPVVPSPAAVAKPNASSSEIGAGGYGIVLKPALPNTNESGSLREFPENVTKVFQREADRDKILKLGPLLDEIMGPNAGHRINSYRRTIRGRNVPATTRAKLKVGMNSPLFPIRMPDLGVNFFDIVKVKKEIRKIPILTIVSQITKVLSQLKRLGEHDYIHGDIREANIMIHPSTGVITIIDFDLMFQTFVFYRVHNFMFYNSPPEWTRFATREKAMEYVRDSYNYFSHLQELYPTENQFANELFKVTEQNLAYLKRIGDDEFDAKSLKTFDSYGLSCTLLRMFHYVYPGSITATRPQLKSILRHPEIMNGTRPYTEEQLEACANTLYDMIHSVLLPLAGLKLEIRQMIDGSAAVSSTLEKDLRDAMEGRRVNLVGGRSQHRSQRRITRRLRR